MRTQVIAATALIAGCSFWLGACSSFGKVFVDKTPVELKNQTVDASMAQTMRLEAGQAVTTWFFHCRPQFEYRTKKLSPPAGAQTVQVTITGGTLRIGLTIQTELTPGATAATLEHEKGHQEICERIYSHADKHAYEAMESVIGKTYEGSGADYASAIKGALQQAGMDVCGPYTMHTARLADLVSADFDQLTLHGKYEASTAGAVDASFKDVLGKLRLMR